MIKYSEYLRSKGLVLCRSVKDGKLGITVTSPVSDAETNEIDLEWAGKILTGLVENSVPESSAEPEEGKLASSGEETPKKRNRGRKKPGK